MTTLLTRLIIFVVVSVLVAAIVYSPLSNSFVFALPPKQGWIDSGNCTSTGDPRPSKVGTKEKMTCCWRERVPGQILGVRYCQTCTITWSGDGWETGDCQEAELQFSQFIPTPTPTPTPLTPLGPLGIPEGGTIQEPTPTPTSPLGPRPFTPLGEATVQEPQTIPTPTPEDDQSDNGPGPFRGPLGGGVLQEPDDEENNNEPEDDGNEEQVP
jgi:hypothetical protein